MSLFLTRGLTSFLNEDLIPFVVNFDLATSGGARLQFGEVSSVSNNVSIELCLEDPGQGSKFTSGQGDMEATARAADPSNKAVLVAMWGTSAGMLEVLTQEVRLESPLEPELEERNIDVDLTLGSTSPPPGIFPSLPK